jgi:hypothetical protein
MVKDLAREEGLLQINTISLHLPPPDTKRWVPRRKAMIVNAVRSGAISLEEVCRYYALSVEEFLTWQQAFQTHGIPGLRVTRLQIYRDAPAARPAHRRPMANPLLAQVTLNGDDMEDHDAV